MARVAGRKAVGNVDGLKNDRAEVAAQSLPSTFTLQAFPDKVLRMWRLENVQRVLKIAGTGQHFGKGTVAEIRAELPIKQ